MEVGAFATMEAFVEYHLEATKGGEQGFSSLEKSAAGKFFAKLPRSLSVELGLVSPESRKQARVPGPGHSTAEGACRARAEFIWLRRQEQAGQAHALRQARGR